ncbi:MAG: glycosyltransferase family 39 protein [Bacteroidota bacterium]|jgi:4-amino-4-deoxy-L-arabinose transferase-like glycosyltransferase
MNKLNFIRICFFIVFFIIIRFVLKFDGLYGQDAYEYLRYTNEMYSFFVNGTFLGDYFWGLGYPFFGCLFNFFIQNTSMALQLVSIVAALVTWIYIDKIIELIYDKKPNYLVSFLFFIMSPIVFVQSLLAMSDMLACCFTTMAVYYFFNYLIKSKNGHFVLGFVLSMLAFNTRYASIIVLFILLVIVFIKIIKDKNIKLILIAFAIGITISLPHILIRANASLNFLAHPLFTEWNIKNLFHSNFTTVDGQFNNKFINLIYCLYSFFHPQFLAFGIFVFLGVAIFKMKVFLGNKFQNIILASTLLFALFLGGIPFQHKRLLLSTFPLVILFLYPVMKNIFTAIKLNNWHIIVIVSIQLGFNLYFGKMFYQRNKLEQTIANDLRFYSSKTIYIFDMDLALKGRNVPLDYQNIWYKEYSNFNKNALVLVNGAQLEKQWIGKNPLINWNKLKINGNLKVLKSYGDGWNLYEIK